MNTSVYKEACDECLAKFTYKDSDILEHDDCDGNWYREKYILCPHCESSIILSRF
jgi:DNA-directed RNA polymerase subunit RPC12/RpoP